jgi:PBSX family phage terminase large subunit
VEQVSEKQSEFYNESDSRINIAEGAVRSGKTFIFILRWIKYLIEGPKGDLLMVGKTIRTLERNVLYCSNGLFELLDNKVKYNRSTGELFALGRRIYCVGANDEKAEGKIRGMTCAGAFCDEITLYPESFVNQLLARCSVRNTQLFWNCNPDSPYHYIKTGFLDNEKLSHIVKRFHFLMEDNPSLDEQYKADLKAMYSGIWYQRYILGLWVLADGVIYSGFDESRNCITNEEVPSFERYYIACDYGITNPHVYLLVGIRHVNGRPHFYIIDEYYNTGKGNSKPKTDNLFYDDYISFKGDRFVDTVVIDPSAASLINLMRLKNVNIRKANNEVLTGINNVAGLLEQNRLFIVKDNCPNLIKEFSSYIWDEKAQLRGLDEPLKENDHALDALRYLCNTLYPVKHLSGFISI